MTGWLGWFYRTRVGRLLDPDGAWQPLADQVTDEQWEGLLATMKGEPPTNMRGID